jgi:D-methionine transport system ATP-binding protein
VLEVQDVGLVTPLRGQLLLEDISFQVKSNTFLAIVGPSGAGKSTLLRLLNRLQEPSTGRIFWQGKSFTEIPVVSLRRQLVLVPQEPKLLGMTVQNALAYPLQLLQQSAAEIKGAISNCLTDLHIPLDWLERSESQLSLGQRQLVSIGRALLLKPQILLLDEPTSALDVGTANHTLTVLNNLVKHQGMSVIMVNHQLEFVKEFAEEIIYLQNGRIIFINPAAGVDWGELREKLIQAERDKVSGEDWD